MNESTVNFTTPEIFTNSTSHYFRVIDSMYICVLSISFTFGLPTHSYVLWHIVTREEGRVASVFFNVNLSVCEIGISLNYLIYATSYCFFSLSTLTTFFVGLTVTGRPLFQSFMCVERFLAVVHPVTFLKYKPLRYRVICCTVAWIIIIASCSMCIYVLKEENRYYYVWFFSTQYLLFLSIQLFCLVAVLRALKQTGPGERKSEKEENQMKRRAFHLILITTLSTAIIYSPYIITGIVTIVVKKLFDPLWFFGFFCFSVAGFVHPVLYLHKTRKHSFLCLT